MSLVAAFRAERALDQQLTRRHLGPYLGQTAQELEQHRLTHEAYAVRAGTKLTAACIHQPSRARQHPLECECDAIRRGFFG